MTEDVIADAAKMPSIMPSHCKLAVVGAGWGGAYAAWRLAIDDAKQLGPSDVCVFEATNRVGGRVYSVHDLPGFGDMALDVGGYRFKEYDLLPAQLVWDPLKLPTACYDYNCSAQCEGANCYVIKDAYGNNAGYATPIETMLGQIEDEGEGQQVFFGKQLSGIYAAAPASRQVRLRFDDNSTVVADKVVLNIPGTALENLDKSSVIFTKSSKQAKKALNNVRRTPAAKVYAHYDDAWWASKLGFMEGYIENDKSKVPLSGRYHDGPLKCVIGHTPAGDPVYSGRKIPFGNCSGALEVFYDFGSTFFQQFMTNPLKPLTVFTNSGSAKGAQFLQDVHSSLMEYHAANFSDKGIDPASISKPTLAVVSNWLTDSPVAPVCGHFEGYAKDEALVESPTGSLYDIYVADVDYGSLYASCWSTSSLIEAEKVLHTKFGLPKPTWLQQAWYNSNILGKSTTPADLFI